MVKVKPVFALISWFVLFRCVSLGKNNDKNTIHRNKGFKGLDGQCDLHYYLSFAFSKVERDDDNVEKGMSEDASTFPVQSFIPSLPLFRLLFWSK